MPPHAQPPPAPPPPHTRPGGLGLSPAARRDVAIAQLCEKLTELAEVFLAEARDG